MNKSSTTCKPEAKVTILVASDIPRDAALVKELLSPEYDQVFLSTALELAVHDFDSRAPDVLVLAFNSLKKSEGYYLGLYRLSGKVHLQPHRTIILCSKDEVQRAYQACRKEHFDDYILFWPMTHDAPRLLMSVYHALCDLAAAKGNLPSSAQFSAQARKLSDLGDMLDQQLVHGSQRIEMANRAMQQAEQEIGAALDGFAGKFAQGDSSGMSKVQNIVRLKQEIQHLKNEEIVRHFRKAAEAVQPIQQWAAELKNDCVPHIDAARSLSAMAERVPQTILVVDDDLFQRKLVSDLLVTSSWRLVFAAGGVEALNILRKMQPDIILMDIMMPELDGIETTRLLKTMPQLVYVPVIMMTGKSEGAAVRESMKAGATDFVVKPLDRETLLAKLAHALNR